MNNKFYEVFFKIAFYLIGAVDFGLFAGVILFADTSLWLSALCLVAFMVITCILYQFKID